MVQIFKKGKSTFKNKELPNKISEGRKKLGLLILFRNSLFLRCIARVHEWAMRTLLVFREQREGLANMER